MNVTRKFANLQYNDLVMQIHDKNEIPVNTYTCISLSMTVSTCILAAVAKQAGLMSLTRIGGYKTFFMLNLN